MEFCAQTFLKRVFSQGIMRTNIFKRVISQGIMRTVCAHDSFRNWHLPNLYLKKKPIEIANKCHHDLLSGQFLMGRSHFFALLGCSTRPLKSGLGSDLFRCQRNMLAMLSAWILERFFPRLNAFFAVTVEFAARCAFAEFSAFTARNSPFLVLCVTMHGSAFPSLSLQFPMV
jgi:hypothetical protein